MDQESRVDSEAYRSPAGSNWSELGGEPMARPTEDIAADIDAFQPTNGNWLALEALLGEL